MKYMLLLSTLLLSACSPTVNMLTPEYKLVKAPDTLYDCPVIKKFPNPDTLTDEQVGKLILKLQRNNDACKNSLDSLHKFYDDADKTLQSK